MELDRRRFVGDARCVRHVAVVARDGESAAALVRAMVKRALPRDDAEAQDREPRVSSLVVTPLQFEASTTNTPYLINVVDANDNIECQSELDAALALCDGLLVLVDADDDVTLWVETAVKKATVEDKRVLVMINKMGKALAQSTESLFTKLERIVSAVNAVIRTASGTEEAFTKLKVCPERGHVVFGSIVGSWGFTIPQLAGTYAKEANVDVMEMAERLWDGSSVCLSKAFEQLIIDPLRNALHASRANDGVECKRTLEAMGLKADDLRSSRLEGWLPLRRSVLQMVVEHVRPPTLSQQDLVCNDLRTHDWAQDVFSCQARGALVAHIVRLISCPENGRYLAVARVLSGIVSVGQDVQVLTHNPTDDKDHTQRFVFDPKEVQCHAAHVEKIGVIVGDRIHDVEVVPAGNVCVLSGLDERVCKTGIVTTCAPLELMGSNLMRQLKAHALATHMIVRATLTPLNPTDHNCLLDAVVQTARVDITMKGYAEDDTGEITLNATTSKCLHRAVAHIRRVHPELAFTASEPRCIYRETVTITSPDVDMARSPNKNVRLFGQVEPIEAAQADDLALASTRPWEELKTRLCHFGWSDRDLGNFLSGPVQLHCGANALVDQSTDRTFFYEHTVEPMRKGFVFGCSQGVLCGEPLFGVRLNITAIGMFGMERHWGRGQFIVAMRRLVLLCQLASSPALLEPVMAVEIQCSAEHIDICMDVMMTREARVVYQNTNNTVVRFHLCAIKCVGLEEELEAAVAPLKLKIHTVFSHYEHVDGDPLDPSTVAGRIVRDVRVLKHMDPDVPALSPFQVAVGKGSVFFNPWAGST